MGDVASSTHFLSGVCFRPQAFLACLWLSCHLSLSYTKENKKARLFDDFFHDFVALLYKVLAGFVQKSISTCIVLLCFTDCSWDFRLLLHRFWAVEKSVLLYYHTIVFGFRQGCCVVAFVFWFGLTFL